METVSVPIQPKSHARADRVGIFASILCAIHCALTPVLLIMMPTFGKAWAHPATHWGMALIVIPIAVIMMRKSYRKNGKKWVVAVGSLGVVLIIVGAILPYTKIGTAGESAMTGENVGDASQVIGGG